LPLVIHTRDAWDETFDILVAEGVPERTVFHCFTGGPDEARRCLDLGAHLSFSGIVTFRTATDLQAAARLCPLDRLLVETDSPYLAPVSGANTATGLRHPWPRSLAAVRHEAPDVTRATVANAASMFGCLAAGVRSL
jgi:TatD DNase family protein